MARQEDGASRDTTSLFVNPGHQNTERSDDVLHRTGRFGLQSYKNFSLIRTPKALDAVPAINFRAQVLNVYDRRNGIEKPVFKLAPIGHEQLFNVIPPGLCAPLISDDVLQFIVSEASAPAQDRTTNV